MPLTNECKHCRQSGTCTNGLDGESCAVCARRRLFRDYSAKPQGLVCSVCHGRGLVEPFSLQLQNRFVPCFAGALVTALFVVLVVTLKDVNQFDKVIGFAGTMIGTIVGYYFGGRRSDDDKNGEMTPHRRDGAAAR